MPPSLLLAAEGGSVETSVVLSALGSPDEVFDAISIVSEFAWDDMAAEEMAGGGNFLKKLRSRGGSACANRMCCSTAAAILTEMTAR